MYLLTHNNILYYRHYIMPSYRRPGRPRRRKVLQLQASLD